jgi:N-acetylglucosamine-6-phosphate deacetylase
VTAELVLAGGRVLTPDETASWVAIAGARIEAVGDGDPPHAAETVDLGGHLLVPGFVDVHVHGGDGAQFMSGKPEAVRHAARFHRAHGTTALLATTLTAPPGELLAAVQAIAEAADEPTLAGIHLEGPFLSERRRGAQDAAALRPPDPEELARLLDAGPISVVSLAPELPGSLELIAQATAAGAIAALAHTDATYEQAIAAIDAGARHAVHTFNGMRPLHHREPGVIGAILDRPEVTAEVIPDGHHVHPAMLRLLGSAKPGATVLVTDAIEAAGLPDGEYELGREPVIVRDRVARTAGGILAGSTLTTDAAVRNAHDAGLPLGDVLAMASTIPARLLGLRKGRIAPGYDADLVVLDRDELTPRATFVAGRR